MNDTFGLRDDDVAELLVAGDSTASGRHVPGSGTELRFGVESLSAQAEMVSHHESAHLELNYVTAFGLLLRAVGGDLKAAGPRCTPAQLGGLVGVCRRTHEIFATTTGVWRGSSPFDEALDAYPQYAEHLDAGRRLAGSLRPGSFAAHTAMMCACWAAMQPPIGALLSVSELHQLTVNRLAPELHPDHRIAALLDADIEPAAIDVALPPSWRDEELRHADLDVPRQHATFVAVAGAYYRAFAAALVDRDIPCYAFDGHKSDPQLHAWLEANPAPTAETIHFRPGEGGFDRFWPVTLSDGERIALNDGRTLVAAHFGDLAPEGGGRVVGRDTFVRGDPGSSSILVVVRPLRTLLAQYDVDEESVTLLRAAATDGIVTAARADVELASGQRVTLLAVLSTRAQLKVLEAMPSTHGVLASVSETCSWFPNWANYWAPAVMDHAHAMRHTDFPRRLWLDGLDAEATPARCQPFSIGEGDDPSGLAGLLVWFADDYDPTDPPFLILASKRTVVTISSALQSMFGQAALVSDAPPQWERAAALVGRLLDGEPWLDARALEDLPDFAKIGDRFEQAVRAGTQ